MFTSENSISKLIFTVFLGAKKGKSVTVSLFYYIISYVLQSLFFSYILNTV